MKNRLFILFALLLIIALSFKCGKKIVKTQRQGVNVPKVFYGIPPWQKEHKQKKYY